jgi:hypothetical protein
MIDNDLKHYIDEQIEIIFQEFISNIESPEEFFRAITILTGKLNTAAVPRAQQVISKGYL